MTPPEASVLLDVADQAILDGLLERTAQDVAVETLPDRLRQTVGSFVTLTVADRLNGCIGHVEPIEPLARDVAHLAWSAAFADPRLPSLEWSDQSALTIEISVLSPLAPIAARSYGQLIDHLEPGVDGLIIRADRRQGVFLPSVWEQLPDADAFLDQLLRKAGLGPGSWPDGMQAFRFDARKYRRTGPRE